MQEAQRTYIAIDLKSFYASVECVDRGLDPLTTNLVVADASRTEKTICLAVSPSLKAYGIGGRARLFEVYQKARGVDFIIAPPRMARYLEVSNKVYETYLKYIAPEDIHVYSVDEVFMDVTAYLRSYKMTAHELTIKMIRDVLATTGITATAGIGTNMYLCKVAMDIMAKKMPADKDGVRIVELDEMSYRRELWDYQPITKFWRVGRGIADKLAIYGIDTMGKLARMSIRNEGLLYRLFGVNAELLIDHAWGWEPATMEAVKAYRPETNSLSSGQVLHEPYTFRKARVVICEMAEGMALSLVSKHLVADQLVLTVSYDAECLTRPEIREKYHGEITTNHYGKPVPKHAHGTFNFDRPTSSSRQIMDGATQLFDRCVNADLLVRRMNITANHVVPEASVVAKDQAPQQLDLFTDYEALEKQRQAEQAKLDKERRMQEVQLKIKKRFGKNAILRGLNFEEGATAKERNKQIGGHKA
ncbi:DNA methylase [Prevotella sp. E15-22]|uniref:Y-family DNA polymerase n=1 Tax=Prevotella sp. E15-22 TaxID=2937774 RepID=UPI00204BAD2C|nr:DNA methylase [Prevotella sp. E15-22]UPS43319.1 DNA methylase [Prevotella sp. E15-22]